MRQDYDLLKGLLPYLEEWEAQNPGKTDVAAFSTWLQKRTERKVTYEEALGPDFEEKDAEEARDHGWEEENMPGNITKLFTFIYRYARFYIKKTFQDSPLNTIDEFGYLITLLFVPSMRKTELIHHNLMEIPSGIEVIKRLLKKGFLQEFPDPEDKRAKRLAITDAGKAVMGAMAPPMMEASKIVVGDLDRSQQKLLMRTLEQLEEFHRPIYVQDHDLSVSEIAEKYLPTG